MKTRKNFYLFTGLMVVLVGAFTLFITLSVNTATAAPTASTTIINGTATINWDNGAGYEGNASLTVGTMYGVTWIGQDNKSGAAGTTVVNTTSLANDGNCTASYTLTSSDTAPGGGTSGLDWATDTGFINVTDAGSLGATIDVSLAAGDTKSITFNVKIPATETNSATKIYQCKALCTLAAASNAVHYIGKDTITHYGGNIGISTAGVGATFMSNANDATASAFTWTVTVQAAAMTLTKTALVSNVAPYNDGDNQLPRPGALVSYTLAYENAGSIDATGVIIQDPLPAVLTYKDDSLSKGAFLGDTSVDDTSGGEGYYDNTGDGTVIFCPGTGGNTPSTGGTVASLATGNYYYQTYVD